MSFDAFIALDAIGLHVLPKHYYSPVPDMRWLNRNRQLWQKRAPMHGIRWDLEQQLTWLKQVCDPYYSEVRGLALYESLARSRIGPGYSPIESQVLYCFVRSQSPHQIVEIGGGLSTAMMLEASKRNQLEGGSASCITSIEPFPKPGFEKLEGIKHLRLPCQAVPESVFSDLGAGDLLFVDSSHSLKMGSDVVRIYLEIIPALKPGVTIHIHDIYLPYLFSSSALMEWYGWQETSLLLALMTNNEKLAVLCSLSGLHHDRRQNLAAVLSDYRPQVDQLGLREDYGDPGHRPVSLWLRTA